MKGGLGLFFFIVLFKLSLLFDDWDDLDGENLELLFELLICVNR
jgi:hypothetical protein